jgi:hypothetical protein
MPLTVAIRRRRRLQKRGLGMPGNNGRILDLARRLKETVDAPVVGGIAVHLHGVPRATIDLDFYAADRKATVEQLEAAGARWDAARREHVLDHVAIHTVTPQDAGVVIAKVSIIDGVRVVTLKDLVAIKLISGLKNRGRSKDLGDVEELIRCAGLDKRFAGKLPKDLRADFKAFVDAVRAGDQAQPHGRRF